MKKSDTIVRVACIAPLLLLCLAAPHHSSAQSAPALSAAQTTSAASTDTKADKRIPRYYGFFEPEPSTSTTTPATNKSSTARH